MYYNIFVLSEDREEEEEENLRKITTWFMEGPLPTDYHDRRAMTQSQVGNDKSQVASCYCLFAPIPPKYPAKTSPKSPSSQIKRGSDVMDGRKLVAQRMKLRTDWWTVIVFSQGGIYRGGEGPRNFRCSPKYHLLCC